VDHADTKLSRSRCGIVVGVHDALNGRSVVGGEVGGAGGPIQGESLIDDGRGSSADFKLQVSRARVESEISGGLGKREIAGERLAVDQNIEVGFVWRRLHDPQLRMVSAASSATESGEYADECDDEFQRHVSSKMAN